MNSSSLFSGSVVHPQTVKEFLKPWTDPNANPKYLRYQLEEKQYGLRNAEDIVSHMKVIGKYPFVDTPVKYVRRGQTLDYREYLINVAYVWKSWGINKMSSTLRAAFSEEVFRGDLDYNPLSGVGTTNYGYEERQILCRAC